MVTENLPREPQPGALQGRFEGRKAFQQIVRDALAQAAQDGWREILICDAAGQAIEILTADLLVEANAQIGDARRMAFVETYEAARRIALGVDRMIDDLIVALV